MALEVAPAEEGDIDRLMEIQFSAFESDPYHDALFPGDHYAPSTRKAAGDRTIMEWRQDPSARFIKCTDRESGVILGYAKWNFYETERPREEWAKSPEVDWYSGRKKEIAENFLGATAAMRQKLWGGDPHYLLNILCVHKDHHRRGAGTMLVQWGVVRAERLGLRSCLEASPAGYPLYLRLGFRQVDTVVVKAADWDGSFDRHYIVMLKQPEEFTSVTAHER
ncbi:hypothetical protein BAUCODRAFT_36425 [Baudoinia panamericana UAMH 10762]|uniref:N-acetyltransferase domain-containing protein n=1 Tax=Baudoinia panamericana (strain UAMH 10762) TaxID=717646 RepID=M2MBT6_BAUPA|nr:uncharacterized protein BAUCODRAFT_36425 [Baudoinia panamericana UAMH 10762]EMC93956.1 hypothetical protein BAUCODRAFT_36425 [Baudoinia panamericana UAMH 10762]